MRLYNYILLLTSSSWLGWHSALRSSGPFYVMPLWKYPPGTVLPTRISLVLTLWEANGYRHRKTCIWPLFNNLHLQNHLMPFIHLDYLGISCRVLEIVAKEMCFLSIIMELDGTVIVVLKAMNKYITSKRKNMEFWIFGWFLRLWLQRLQSMCFGDHGHPYVASAASTQRFSNMAADICSHSLFRLSKV